MNTYIRKRNAIQSYLTKKYDLDKSTINHFLIFYKKDIKEKLELYKQKELSLQQYDNDTYNNDLPYENENLDINNHYEEMQYDFPMLEFENDIREEFKKFRQECLDDKMLDLYYNIQIDDFYRLFAPEYNPIF